MRFRVTVALALAAMLIAVIPTSGAAGGSQEWFFLDDPYGGTAANDGTSHSIDGIMSTTTPDGPLEGEWIGGIWSTSLTAWWYAENPAAADVTFGAGTWNVNLWYFNTFGPGTLHAEVFSVADDGTSGLPLAAGETSILGGMALFTDETISLAADVKTVPAGNRLALRLWFVPDELIAGMIVFYNGPDWLSSLESPSTDPGYPLPEATAALLLGGGLAALAGYLALDRRRKANN